MVATQAAMLAALWLYLRRVHIPGTPAKIPIRARMREWLRNRGKLR